MKNKTFLKNAAVISLGGLAAKCIGALYRLPLTGFLGGYGMGLYQMAYPLFCVLLTFSSAGIPSALARMIAGETARGRTGRDTAKVALRLFALIGLAGTALMCLFAPYMSALQGDSGLLYCYLALAPSVFFVALIAVLRGYFQGLGDMRPTALSAIVEQIFKAGAGLVLAWRFQSDPARAVAYTLLAVTLSEFAALAYLLLRYRSERRRGLLRVRSTAGRDILAAAFPVMAAAALMPISQTVDSVVIVRLLSRFSDRAVSLYGLFAGGAVSLVNLPATVCYGLAAATVPAVSRALARGEEGEARDCALRSLVLTLAFSVPCAVGLFLLAKPIVAILYSSLSVADSELLVRLVRLLSVSAVSIAAVDTLAACLTGLGRAKLAALSMLTAVSVKLVLQFLLVGNPALSVGGAAIAANACYLVAFFLDLFYTVRKKKGERSHDHNSRIRNGEGRFEPSGIEGDQGGGQGARAHGEATLRRKPA